jgi:hypothetical protein
MKRRIALKKRLQGASDVVLRSPHPRLSRLGNMRWPCRLDQIDVATTLIVELLGTR